MNKIVETNEQIIIAYNLVGDRLNSFKEISDQYSYRIIHVEDKNTYCTVENIINENYYDCIKEDADSIDMEFLLFVNIVNDDLYDFLADLKKIGLYFPNKAILTPTNLNWRLRRLLAENKEEHLVMTMFTNLRRAMKKAELLVSENKFDDELLQIMEDAKHYLNPREFEFDEMKEIHNKLAIKVNQLK